MDNNILLLIEYYTMVGFQIFKQSVIAYIVIIKNIAVVEKFVPRHTNNTRQETMHRRVVYIENSREGTTR